MDMININGVTVISGLKNCYKQILDYQVNNEDIWICSYPKNGTTWTQEMVWLIGNNLDYKKAENESLQMRSPFLEFSSVIDYKYFFTNPTDFQNSPFPLSYLENSVEFVGKQPSPRYIKTHLPWALLPLEIQNFVKKPKIIYISRNSKDNCTSYYHFSKYFQGFNGDFQEFCQIFLDGKLHYGNYWDHTVSYLEHSNKSNILFLKYEDMRRDLSGIIGKISNFLGKNLSENAVKTLEKHLSFESMQKNPSVNKTFLINLFKRKYDLMNTKLEFMRSGSVNDHKTVMTEEIVEKFNQMDRKNFGKFHLKF